MQSDPSSTAISSPQNPRVKEVIRLRRRGARDRQGLLLVEGYRECLRATDNGYRLQTLYFCPELFLGENEDALLNRCAEAGTHLLRCAETPFRRMAYRDRPDGLLGIGPQIHRRLDELPLSDPPLLLVVEQIEKPGNLGTMLRSADAAGADGVIVCDRCTDINNPNVVRASIGTLFTVPIAEASSEDTIAWLRQKGIRIVSATPHTDTRHTRADLSGPAAVVVGAEQYGLSDTWRGAADIEVRIPMKGQADSLNVSAAATILLYEALRQREDQD